MLKLNRLPNVQTVGYIDTQGGKRDREIVRAEMEIYAGWNKSKIAISDVFFDRIPFQESEDGEGVAEAYLKNITATARRTPGFLEPTIVVQNPGSIPDANFKTSGADVTVVFEGAYAGVPKRDAAGKKLAELGGKRKEAC
jgi:hypothetical protein